MESIPENTPERRVYITGHANWTGAELHKRRSPWRYHEETGKYDNRPNDKDYFRKYMAVRVECPVCSRMVLRGVLYKHKKRAICINTNN